MFHSISKMYIISLHDESTLKPECLIDFIRATIFLILMVNNKQDTYTCILYLLFIIVPSRLKTTT